jgi:hypothetical protein
MTNTMRGCVEIELDRKRQLRYTWNALAEFQDIAGKSPDEMLKDMRIATLRALLFCGLHDEDEALTQKQVGAMVDSGNMGYVVMKIREALTVKLPEAEGKKAEAANVPPSSIGTK